MQVFDVLLDPPLNLVTLHLTDTIKSYKNKLYTPWNIEYTYLPLTKYF